MTTTLLIPGLLCDAFVWEPTLKRLGGDVLVADLSTQDSIADMAADCLALAEGPLAVAGHSMGARVAMEMARQAPERIVRLALLDTGIHPLRDGEPEKREQAIRLAYDEGMEALAERWLPGMVCEGNLGNESLMPGLKQMVLRCDADLHARQIKALIGRPDAAAYLSEIPCPTLLLVGRQDKWSPVSQHEDMLALLPDARLEIVENAGHFAPVEQPDTVAGLLADFLNSERTQATNKPVPLDLIPETPLLDRAHKHLGYELNKMANSLSKSDNRAAFKSDEAGYLDRFALTEAQRKAVMTRDWEAMMRLGGNLFYVLKISAVDPVPITAIGAAQAGMTHEDFLEQRLGKKLNG